MGDDEIRIKPFILASTRKGSVEEAVAACTESLTGAGFTIAGTYKMNDKASVIVITTEELKALAAKSDKGGFGACQRVACTANGNGEVEISFTNPKYMAFAYRMDGDNNDLLEKMIQVLGKDKEFGSEKGKTEKSLRKYHYKLGMEYFDETETLLKAGSFEEAVAACETNLEKNASHCEKVARIDIPGKKEVLFVCGCKSNDKFGNDEWYMGKIDCGTPKHTAHLPYEMLVTEHKVVMMHGRFRIAVNFTDLDMTGDHGFTSIMDTPSSIKRCLQVGCGAKDVKAK